MALPVPEFISWWVVYWRNRAEFQRRCWTFLTLCARNVTWFYRCRWLRFSGKTPGQSLNAKRSTLRGWCRPWGLWTWKPHTLDLETFVGYQQLVFAPKSDTNMLLTRRHFLIFLRWDFIQWRRYDSKCCQVPSREQLGGTLSGLQFWGSLTMAQRPFLLGQKVVRLRPTLPLSDPSNSWSPRSPIPFGVCSFFSI